VSLTEEQIDKLKMDGISTSDAEKKISTIRTLEAYAESQSKDKVINAILRIIGSSPRPEVTKAGHESIQRIKG